MVESAMMRVMILASLWSTASCHDTIADVLWPLTNYTAEREVVSGGREAVLTNSPGHYLDGEPHLGYPALDLAQTAVSVVLGKHIDQHFTLAGMFYLNLRQRTDVFMYEFQSDVKFSVYIYDCVIYVHTPDSSGPYEDDIKSEHCPDSYGWYTVAVQWKDHLKACVVRADLGEEKGKAVVTVDANGGFGFDTMPQPGNLTVGRADQGVRLCCLRVYQEEVDKGHIEEQMYEDCEELIFWKSAEPSPCGTKPCENGGTCITTGRNYTCLCRPWFTGKNCTTELWMTKQDFVFVGEVDLTGRLEPIAGLANISSRSERECSSRCLQVNMCMSFTFGQKLCTLYNDVTQDYSGSAVQYFVERSQIRRQ